MNTLATRFTLLATFLAAVFLASAPTFAEEAATAPATEKTQGPLRRGDTPPPPLGRTRSGDVIETTQFSGKVLVVTFWATWCAPCRAELAVLEGLQQVAKGAVQVVAVNIEDRDTFRAAARKLAGFTLTLTSDAEKRIRAPYGVKGIPHMVIIGKDGKIINVHRGYGEESLDKLVAEINAALAAS